MWDKWLYDVGRKRLRDHAAEVRAVVLSRAETWAYGRERRSSRRVRTVVIEREGATFRTNFAMESV